MNNNIITASYDDETQISFTEDAWFNATETANKFGKRPIDWLKLESTKEYIAALCELIRSEESSLLKTKRGGRGKSDSTWFHPKLAVRFAQWLDVRFAVWCDMQIEKILQSFRPSGNAGQLPEPPTKLAYSDCLTLDQQDAIKALVKERAAELPKEKQGGAAIKMWSAIKRKYGVSYKEIPSEHFVSVISLISRLPLSGESIEQGDQFLIDPKYRIEARKVAIDHVDQCRAAFEQSGLKPPAFPKIDEQIIDGLLASMLWHSRWFLTFDPDTLKPSLTQIPMDAIALNEQQWIKYMTQERGYIVVKQKELLTKLTT